MKHSIRVMIVTLMLLVKVSVKAHVPFSSIVKVFYPINKDAGQIFNKKIVTAISFGDSLLSLEKNYPIVYKNLFKEFKTIESLNYWIKESSLHISFNSDNKQQFAVYTMDGKLNYAISNIGKELPGSIREQLQNNYPDWLVFYAKKIKTQDTEVYEVVIENTAAYKLLNFMDKEIEELKTFKKENEVTTNKN